MTRHVTSASEDPPEYHADCVRCGRLLCRECECCPSDDCQMPPCNCPPRVRIANSIPDDRWQQALDDAADAAVDDDKVAEAEAEPEPDWDYAMEQRRDDARRT